MTAIDKLGNHVRGFQVHVDLSSNPKSPRKGRKGWMYHPATTGAEAIRNMETLAKRGWSTLAYTEAHGIEEALTLAEMKGIFV